MVTENRGQTSEIIDRLIAKSSTFSFVQAVRLLLKDISSHKLYDGHEITQNEALEKYIRIRPELSLGFPGTDITKVERSEFDPDQFLITATFLGLYGSSTPLPTFYTEDLIEELNDGESIKRDFIDIINHAIYPLFFKIWSKHRLFYKICEENDESIINLIYCFLGLENKELREDIYNIEKYFRYAGLTMQFPRSAEGLGSILEDCFNLKNQIQVNQCVPRKVPIPNDQHSFLGVSSCTLGEDSVIGKVINDISGKFQVHISGADTDILHSLLPDKQRFMEFKQMVNFYVNQPLDWELVIELDSEKLETTQPGNNNWSHLGWNTWLVSENKGSGKAQTCFH
ncbi:MAG: type VI secretion system baseplate subunit TssG [Desulfobacteraceae bacterium]|nr:type VI secretion system baseplate subunit TssG [Desulfobacteraceae bacterium]